MAEYRRFISYFYEYIDGRKGKNVGFAKVELRNGVWRILFRLTADRQPDEPVQAYGFVRKNGWMLGLLMGTMHPGRNMTEEWAYRADRMVWKEEEMTEAYGISDLSGIWIQTADGQCYATGWDDEPIEPGRFVRKLPEETAADAPTHAKAAAPGETSMVEKIAADGETPKIARAAAEDVLTHAKAASEKISMIEKPVSAEEVPACVKAATAEKAPMVEHTAVENMQMIAKTSAEKDVWMIAKAAAENVQMAEKTAVEDEISRPAECADEKNADDADNMIEHSDDQKKEKPEICGEEMAADLTAMDNRKEADASVAESEKRLQEHVYIWKELFQNRQMLAPFADGSLTECVRIAPCDLMRLRQKGWQVGRSTFLLHAFYQYQHLLLARTKNGNFVIGVPGILNPQERYMAQMFGYQEFRRTVWSERGKVFGYWCRELTQA